MIEIQSKGNVPERMKNPSFWIHRMLTDLFWFSKVVMHHGKEEEYRDLNWVHMKLCDFLDSKKNPVLQKLVIMFRDGLKSCIGRSLLIQWFLNKIEKKARGNAFIYCGIVDLAEDHAEIVAKEILENKLIQGFFRGKIPSKKSEFDTCKREKISFKGIEIDIGSPEKSLTGHHYELGINDNIVNEVNSQNSTQRAKIIRRWQEEEAVLKENAREIILETTWWPDDLSGYILDGEDCRFDFSKIYRKPCHIFNAPTGYQVFTCPAVGKGGVPVWPEKVDEVYLKRKRIKMGPYLYNALYELQPTIEENIILRPAWIIHYKRLPYPFIRHLAIDMAGTKGEQSTHTGMSLGDWDWMGKIYIPYAERRKASPMEVREWVHDLVKKCNEEERPISSIGIEKEKYGIYLADHLRDDFRKMGPRIVLLDIDRPQDDRISALITPYEQGFVISRKGLKDYEYEVKSYHRKKIKGTDILNTIYYHFRMRRLPRKPREQYVDNFEPRIKHVEGDGFSEQVKRERMIHGMTREQIARSF